MNSLKSTGPGLTFYRCFLLLHSEFRTKLYRVRWFAIVAQGQFKVIAAGTNWKLVCDFLLVFHGNYRPTFHLFRDHITIYWSKICVFDVFTQPSLVLSLVVGVPLDLRYESWYKKNSSPWATRRQNCIIVRPVLSQYHGRTDGQTDRQTDTLPMPMSYLA